MSQVGPEEGKNSMVEVSTSSDRRSKPGDGASEMRPHDAVTEVETEVLRKISLFFTRKSCFFTRSSYAKGRLGGFSSAGA